MNRMNKEKRCFICQGIVPTLHIDVGKQSFCSEKCYHEYLLMTPEQEKARHFKNPTEAEEREGWMGE